MDLLAIGTFARMARLSPKALRLYDELRLLPPAHVDPDTGYRWYSPDQLVRARRVVLLRQLDMPLARIKKVLDLPPDAAAGELAAYWDEQEQSARAKRELVAFLLNQFAGKRSTMYEVSVRDIPARALLSITEHLTADQIGEFATPLFALFGGPNIPRPEGVAGLPFLRYHGQVSNDSDAPVEFCCPIGEADINEVASRFPDMASSSEPAMREAFIRVPKADMLTALGFESLHQWLIDHNEQTTWAPRQIFLLDPSVAKSTDIVYELAIPLR
ncbi:MerR family transcriptional regulator [Nocardia terpenica]|uniref:MerR family transcriptional regulator n=1 Tax=Nocardia terpenica TaxID=455432 RepID=UPI0018953287|nr:helix-turn-helix domain-containing protein [Nocardia terpenica]MBF6065807.1 MerR family transcriptional regulator [Nocardia terpenica]MBF6108430.1 MerR family transcriptional regulator [Nocardia terpenica]MBF6115922.1 MerR family transcriptional regulator [Nocardia terpenica]MBF6123052.1 MerR family transcriptional regulator [Nocardia terpenica]MBF6156274.1 MerR family transcriptional regulator [Nocardia terpenica]